MRRTLVLLIAIAAVAPTLPAADSQPASPPAPTASAASQAAEASPQKVAVVSVSGPAEKLVAHGDQENWLPLRQGEELDELTVIRTGLRATVVLRFADRGEVTVNSASKMGIGEFRKQGEQVTGRLGLKYGTIRASIEKSRGPNDFTIATPVATLSIQGSGADVAALVDSPMIVKTYSGAWRTVTSSGSRTVRAGQATNQALSQWVEIAKDQRETSMAALGQTPVEQQSLTNNGGGRGVFSPAPSGNDVGGIIAPPPPPPPPPPQPPTPPPPIPPPCDQ